MSQGIASRYVGKEITICQNCFHGNVCGNRDYLTENECCNFVSEAPTIDKVAVRCGRWTLFDEDSNVWSCSVCDEPYIICNDDTPRENNYNYCPNCGAKMDKGGGGMNMEQITISKEEYDRLIERDNWLNCLEAAGLDNWDGCDYAFDLLHEGEVAEEVKQLIELEPTPEEIEELLEAVRNVEDRTRGLWLSVKSNDEKTALHEINWIENVALNAACKAIQVAAMCRKYRESLLK